MARRSIAFVDDHPVLLSGIQQIFSAHDEYSVVATGTSADDLLGIAASVRPDIVVTDLNMPGRVLDAVGASLAASPATRFIAFTASSCIDTALAALERGIHGYVLKGASVGELRNAIDMVLHGDTYVTPSIASKLMERLRKPSRPKGVLSVSFTPREDAVLRLLMKGCTNKEIADALSISDKTVKHYMTVLIQKLQVRNRVEVVIAAQELMGEGAGAPNEPAWAN